MLLRCAHARSATPAPIAFPSAAFSCDEVYVATLGGEDDGNLVRQLGATRGGAPVFWLPVERSRPPDCTQHAAIPPLAHHRLPLTLPLPHALPQAIWDLQTGAALAGSPASTGFVRRLAFFHRSPHKLGTGMRTGVNQ